MERRAFLTASGTTIAVLSGGCLGIGTDAGDERDYSYRVNNGAAEPQSFRVRVGNEGEMWFHEETFELNGQTVSDDIAIDETPARLFIRVGSNAELEFPWPASQSELGTAAQQTNIWYEPTLDQEIIIYGDD